MFHFYYFLIQCFIIFSKRIVNKIFVFMNPIRNDGVQRAEFCVCGRTLCIGLSPLVACLSSWMLFLPL